MVLSSRVQRSLSSRHSSFGILAILRLASQPLYNGVVAWYVAKVSIWCKALFLLFALYVLQSPYTVYVLNADVCVPSFISCCNLTILTLCGYIFAQQTRYYWKYTGSETSQYWTPDMAAGTEVVFQIIDYNGIKATSYSVTVQVRKITGIRL